MALHRSSGILLHLTSLPGKYGIGDLGDGAYNFIDFLRQAGQTIWQILPFGPTGYGDSPYQATSAFAGNTLLISLDRLLENGWLNEEDIADMPEFPEHYIDYGRVIEFHNHALNIAFEKFQVKAELQQKNNFEAFCRSESNWLDDFALFSTFKDCFSGSPWMSWESKYAQRDPDTMAAAKETYSNSIQSHKFRQWLFFMQWEKIKEYAREKKVQIIGDMPLFVAHDGADIWANQHIFQLDERGYPTVVAGVPPDYFSTTGQLWGNPLFNWNVLRRQHFDWWVRRFNFALRFVDHLRIDHFRGFDSTWEIPADETTAVHGRYVRIPGVELFNTIEKEIGNPGDFMIAEDLGAMIPSVIELRDKFGIPGMKVLQFAFSDSTNTYLPHNFDTTNCVVYTGTHDNNTVLGWYMQETFDSQKDIFREYVGHDITEPHWDMIRIAMQSIAAMSIFPLQDVFGLGADTRMNAPGAMSNNWSWRFIQSQLTPELSARLRHMTGLFNRLPITSLDGE